MNKGMMMIKKFLMLLLSIAALTACGDKPTKWTEEVLLSDNSVVLVEREVQGHWNIQAGYSDFKRSLEVFKIANTELPQWVEKWKPLILDKNKQGRWYLIVTPAYCYDWNSKFPYRQYELIDNKWQQVEFDPVLNPNGRKANLVWSIKIGKMPSLIKLSEKPFNDANSVMIPRQYKEIAMDVTVSCGLYCWRENSTTYCGAEDFCRVPNNKPLQQCIDYEKEVMEKCKKPNHYNDLSCRRLFQEKPNLSPYQMKKMREQSVPAQSQ